MVFFSTGKRRVLEFGFLVVLCWSFGVVESKCNRGCQALASYYVWEGSNLTFIGQLMGGYTDPFTEILQYNPQIPSKYILQADARINIPFSCNCINGEFLGHVFDYTVVPGDTYEKVAGTWFSNLTTVDWLRKFNVQSGSRIPDVNARLNVTVNCSCGNEDVSKDYDGLFVTYPLRPGESLNSIATNFNVSAPLLQRYNGDSNFSSGIGLVYIPLGGKGGIPPLHNGTIHGGLLPLRSKIMIGVFVGVGVVGGLILLLLLFIYRKNHMKRRERIMNNPS